MITLAVKLSKNSLDILQAVENQDKLTNNFDHFNQMLDLSHRTGKIYYVCVDFVIVEKVDTLLEIDTVYVMDEGEFFEAWRFVNNRENHLSAVYPK